jgi:hypothetical protein
MSGKNDGGTGLLGRGGEDVRARAFDGDFVRLESQLPQIADETIPDRTFIPGDGFDIDELASKSDDVHGEKHKSRGGFRISRWYLAPGIWPVQVLSDSTTPCNG